jgi:hypothetical protein
MKRREFITLLGGVVAGWPLAARAQQRIPRAGFLFAGTPSLWCKEVAAIAQRLGELGWIEGRTVAIEYRWVESRAERLASAAAEFVELAGVAARANHGRSWRRRGVVRRDRPSRNPKGNHHASPSGGRQAHRAAGYEGAVGSAGLRAKRQYVRRVCCPIQGRNCEMDEGNSTGGYQGAMRRIAC